MQEVQAHFKECIARTSETQSFRFIPDQPLDFLPGQFLQLIFDEANKQNRDLNKYLSFSCMPGTGYIEVTKRLTGSAFSERLRSLRPGDTVLLKAPMGQCVLKEEQKKIGFIIGGIGITPVISMLEDVVARNSTIDICLVYANRTCQDIAFKDMLDAWAQTRPSLRIVYTVDTGSPAEENGIVGFINEAVIRQVMPDNAERFLYVFGPPVMVTHMHALCLEIGCDPALLTTEKFIGYEDKEDTDD